MQACLITLVRGEKYKISGGGASLARDMIERETERKGRERGRGRLKALDCTRSAGCGWDRIGWQAGTHHLSVLVSEMVMFCSNFPVHACVTVIWPFALINLWETLH